jgi:hypothetical protein
LDFVGSDSKHRDAVERIAGTTTNTPDSVADALRHPAGRRGAVLIYVASDPVGLAERKVVASDVPPDPDPCDLAALISVVAPATATPHGRSVIEWTVRRKSQWGSAVVDSSGSNL